LLKRVDLADFCIVDVAVSGLHAQGAEKRKRAPGFQRLDGNNLSAAANGAGHSHRGR
jgi:hypothetical protein